MQIARYMLRLELQLPFIIPPGMSPWAAMLTSRLPSYSWLWEAFESKKAAAIRSEYAMVSTVRHTPHESDKRFEGHHVATLPTTRESRAGRVAVVELKVAKWHYVKRTVDKHCVDRNGNQLRLITSGCSDEWWTPMRRPLLGVAMIGQGMAQ